MRRRAYTLIELMFAIVLVGILAALSGSMIVTARRDAADLALRERAWQLAEYEADRIAHHQAENHSVLPAMMAELPEGDVDLEPSKEGLTHITVYWKKAGGQRGALSLAVYGGRPW